LIPVCEYATALDFRTEIRLVEFGDDSDTCEGEDSWPRILLTIRDGDEGVLISVDSVNSDPVLLPPHGTNFAPFFDCLGMGEELESVGKMILDSSNTEARGTVRSSIANGIVPFLMNK